MTLRESDPRLPPVRKVRIRRLPARGSGRMLQTTAFRYQGRVVEIGEEVTVDADIARQLIEIGKAARAE